MRLFGVLLAQDMQSVPPDTQWLPHAQVVVEALDQLDVGGDEELDRRLEELSRAPGPIWLDLAEDGFFTETHFVGHVLHFFGLGGYPGRPFVQDLLRAIATGDEDDRDALSLGKPEYVGLMRAATEVADGIPRLLAVLDRK